METKNFFVILLSVILAFTLITILGSVITGYVVHGDLNKVLTDETMMITSIFSIVILVSILVLRKKKIKKHS